MRRLLERLWFFPVFLVLSALLWWVQAGAEWDPWRVLAPLLGWLATVGVLRLGQAERRRFGWVALLVGSVLVAVLVDLLLDDGSGTTTLVPARDAALVVGVAAVGIAVLWVRGFFKPGAQRGAAFEVGVIAVAVFAVTVLVLDSACWGLTALEMSLVVVFAAFNALSVGVVVVMLLAEGSRNVSAVLIAVGLLVTMAAAVWHLRAALLSDDETWLSWMFVSGFALAVSGVWHSSVVRLRDTLGGPSRPLLSGFAVTAALWCGAVVLTFGEESALTYAAGVACGVSVVARAVGAARSSWLSREESSAALVRGVLVRDDERAQLKRLLHDDVLQPIVVASWLTSSHEARVALEELEERTRSVLNKLEPRAPQISEIGQLLVTVFHESRDAVITQRNGRGEDVGTCGINVVIDEAANVSDNASVRVGLWFVARSAVAAAVAAGARHVGVWISFEQGQVCLVVIDDAAGDAARKTRNERLKPVLGRVNDGAGDLLIGEAPDGTGLVEARLPIRVPTA
jgi:signal transduction histidine kinase